MLREYARRSRRAFLGGITAGMASLAGCQFGNGPYEATASPDRETPDPGERATAVHGRNTEAETRETTTGTEGRTARERRGGVPPHDHADDRAGGDDLRPSSLRVGEPPFDRPLLTLEDRTVSVPGDYETVQAAVSDIPLFVQHGYSIDVEPGTYDEDVVVPAFVHTHHAEIESEGGFVNLVGDEGDPGRVELGSLYVAGPTGRLPLAILGLTLTRDNPYDDEATALAFYGGGEHYVRNVNVGDGTDGAIGNGVLAYAASVHVDWVDFGDLNVRSHGYSVKHGGQLMEQKVRETPSEGTVGGYAYDPEEGTIFFRGSGSTLSGVQGLVKGNDVMNGIAFDTQNRALYNVGKLIENR